MPGWLLSLLLWVGDSQFFWFGLRALARYVIGWRRADLLPRRDQLGRVHHIPPLLDPAKYAIHGLWITGASWLEQDQELLRRGAIKRVVFPHPEDATGALDIMQLETPRELPKQQDELRRMTREAQRMGIPVKWFPAFLNMTMTFVNPEQVDGYVFVELVLPHMEPSARPVFRVFKHTDEKVFTRLWREYEAIYRDAKLPPPLFDGK